MYYMYVYVVPIESVEDTYVKDTSGICKGSCKELHVCLWILVDFLCVSMNPTDVFFMCVYESYYMYVYESYWCSSSVLPLESDFLHW